VLPLVLVAADETGAVEHGAELHAAHRRCRLVLGHPVHDRRGLDVGGGEGAQVVDTQGQRRLDRAGDDDLLAHQIGGEGGGRRNEQHARDQRAEASREHRVAHVVSAQAIGRSAIAPS
jgi:hypothetical protein